MKNNDKNYHQFKEKFELVLDSSSKISSNRKFLDEVLKRFSESEDPYKSDDLEPVSLLHLKRYQSWNGSNQIKYERAFKNIVPNNLFPV